MTTTDENQTTSDPVNHPKHYLSGGFELMDIIEAYNLGFCDGNVLKYIVRWRRKDGLQDLKKAAWYLNRLIETETKNAAV